MVSETHLEPTLHRKIRSKIDPTVKYVFLTQEQVAEFSYIDNGTGKDIICVPSQTACNLGCRFCFLSDCDLKVRGFSSEELVTPIRYVIDDMGLLDAPERKHVLLISVMGCGEPLLNVDQVLQMCNTVRNEWSDSYQTVRFGLASLIPNTRHMLTFIERVRAEQLQLKFHLSLHSPEQETRSTLMPGAARVRESVILTELFIERTGNSAEMHYALIDGVNDRDRDMDGLIDLLKGRGIPVKFLIYNEKPTEDMHRSLRVSHFRQALEGEGIATEFYAPPGADIGSSCGQFLMDLYQEFNGAT